MSTKVRLADESDFVAIIELGRRASNEAPAYVDRELDPARCETSLSLCLSEGFLLVSEDDGRPVGYLLALMGPRPFHGGRDATVVGLYVEPASRGGPSLLELASSFLSLSRDFGCDGAGISVSSGLHVRETASVLERLGMPMVGTSHYVEFQDR